MKEKRKIEMWSKIYVQIYSSKVSKDAEENNKTVFDIGGWSKMRVRVQE